MHEKGEKQKRDQNGTNDKEQNEEEEQRDEGGKPREGSDRISRRWMEGWTERMRVLQMSKKKVNTDLLGEASRKGKRQITNFLFLGKGELSCSLFVLESSNYLRKQNRLCG